jgi:quinol-cytochrome oxidoreductase complex cytochrome b subunit
MALYPDAALRAAVAVALAAVALVALASFAPPRVGAPAASALAHEALRPSWYLAFFDQLLRAAPPRLIGLPSASVIGAAATAGVAALLLLPALDRRASRVGQVAVLVALAAIAGGTIRALAR